MISICIKSNNKEILSYINNKIDNLSNDDIYYRKHSFSIFDNIIIHYKGKNIDDFYQQISKIVSETIIVFYEPILVNRIINQNYFYFNTKDKEIIFDEYDLIKNKNTEAINNYSDSIKIEVEDYLKSNKVLILSGFVDFRLFKYKKTFRRTCNRFSKSVYYG